MGGRTIEILVNGWSGKDTKRAMEQGDVRNGSESEDGNKEQYDEDNKFESEDGNEVLYDEDDQRWKELGIELEEPDEEEYEGFCRSVQPEIDLIFDEAGIAEGW